MLSVSDLKLHHDLDYFKANALRNCKNVKKYSRYYDVWYTGVLKSFLLKKMLSFCVKDHKYTNIYLKNCG